MLALGALMLGVPRAMAIDIDDEALRVAADNARVNGLADRLRLAHGTPDDLTGQWPLVLANVLTAPLIEMAPALSQRVGHAGDAGAVWHPRVTRTRRGAGVPPRRHATP